MCSDMAVSLYMVFIIKKRIFLNLTNLEHSRNFTQMAACAKFISFISSTEITIFCYKHSNH